MLVIANAKSATVDDWALRLSSRGLDLGALMVNPRSSRQQQLALEIERRINILKKITTQILMLAMVLLLLNSHLFAQTRIRFRTGSTSTTVSGRIAAGARRSFVLRALPGQYLSATISSRTGCVVFGNGGTSTDYRTRMGANYIYIENNCGGATSFSLTVSIS